MKKQGFTLIELMVVIVIMGILAAVAVPKLFGMIAKSKASEVGPAAGTYVKLQESYFSESNAIGGWSLIGYKAPGAKSINDTIQGTTTNFQYDQKGTYTNGTIAVDNSGNIAETEVWAAKNYAAKLNDCVKDSEWLVKATVSNSVVTFAAEVPTAAGCKELTPSFTGIGK